ncbi:MAG TPA: OB-fold domain-containing protein [Kineosporiaceae bacterium]|nr:OB-fold domain-containing protein [Kineosporiaceae bacterium]
MRDTAVPSVRSEADVEADAIRAAAARVAAAGESARRPGSYPVNQPMIDHWLSAMDSYRPADAAMAEPAEFAPPAMIQVWTMPGLRGQRAADDPLAAMMSILDQAGYTSVVATNCEQIYHRYLRDGEQVSVSARLTDVTGPKRTALGEGWFVTTRSTWFVDDEPVAEMVFRVLKFRTPQAASAAEAAPVGEAPVGVAPVGVAPVGEAPVGDAEGKPAVSGDPLRPVVSRDTEFFWAGTAAHELRIQRCTDCGTLRHPPGPRCTACGSQRQGYLLAGGTGTIFSYVVHHHPPVSGRATPFVVVLVELPEGVRMLGELVGVDPLDAAAIQIGSQVQLIWQQVDDELTLPGWRIEAGG